MPKMINRLEKNDSSHRCAALAAGLVTLMGLVAPGISCAQKIVKWIDAQGQTHYSDHAPTGQDTEAVSVHAAPTRPAPTTTAATPTVAQSRSTAAITPTAAETAAAREAAEEQRRADRRDSESASKAQADDDLISKCNQARETYCNEGADAIRQRDTTRAELQYADAISARQERISRGLRPGALPPPPP